MSSTDAPKGISVAYLPLAVASLALASYPNDLMAMTAALVGTVVLGLRVAAGPDAQSTLPRLWGLLLVVGLVGLGLAAPPYLRFPHPSPTVFVLGAFVVMVAAVVVTFVPPKSMIGRILLLATVLAVVGYAGFLVVRATTNFGIDVVELHYQAADALSQGISPYGDAVEVANGTLIAPPGSTIVGYPYPPVTAIFYAIPVWLFDEPRWTSLAAWLVTLATAAMAAMRTQGASGALAFLALAALPAWSFMIQAGWTEILTLGLLAAAIGTWSRWPITSAILLGMAVASKQYFLAILPLLFFHPQIRGRRSLVVLSTVAITIVPLAILDPANAWHALVGFHANTAPRPDSANLVGLLFFLGAPTTFPLLLLIGLPFALAWVLARRGDGLTDLLTSVALVLSVFFMFSSQAFTNYWFLIAGLSGLAMAYGQKGHLASWVRGPTSSAEQTT